MSSSRTTKTSCGPRMLRISSRARRVCAACETTKCQPAPSLARSSATPAQRWPKKSSHACKSTPVPWAIFINPSCKAREHAWILSAEVPSRRSGFKGVPPSAQLGTTSVLGFRWKMKQSPSVVLPEPVPPLVHTISDCQKAVECSRSRTIFEMLAWPPSGAATAADADAGAVAGGGANAGAATDAFLP
eukprot:1239684-Rhodomonas_salina.2